MISGSVTNVGYDTLRESLTHAGAVIPTAELHGGISGAICAGGPSAAARWLDDVLAEPGAEQTAGSLDEQVHALVAVTWRALQDAQLAFEPLLPDDDADLNEQVQALASWCQGFLSALGLSAPDVIRPRAAARGAAAPAVEEILSDFAEIGRAGVTDDDAADRDGADFALAELHEYVRVSVQIVFDELVERRSAAAREVH